MANNCLKTQLKSVVVNENLCKLKENRYENTTTSNMIIRFDTNGATPVNARLVRGSASNNVYGNVTNLVIGDNSINTQGMFKLTVTPGSLLFINNKYLENIKRIDETNVQGNTEDLKYMSGYTTFISSRNGDVSFLKNKALTVIELLGSFDNIEEGLSGSKSTLTRVSSSNNHNKVANVSYWIDFTSITTFSNYGNSNLLIGNLEDLINGWIDKGRTSGTLSLGYPRTLINLTYDNGTGRKTIAKLYPQDSTISVTWDAQGNITIS